MANPTIAQTNVLDSIQKDASAVLHIRGRLPYDVQMFANENVASLTSAEIQTLSTFAGITDAEALAAKNTLSDLYTWLGDPMVVGTNAYKLLKVAYNIP